MNQVAAREFYSSSNGDRWHLCRDQAGEIWVLHQPNIPSGGKPSRMAPGDFLKRSNGPEQQALTALIASLIDAADNPGELLTEEADPGLSLTGGSGHA